MACNRRAALAVGALLGPILECLALPAAAGPEPDGWLYVINVAREPVAFKLDQAETAQLPALTRIARPVALGGHGLAAVYRSRVVSQYNQLEAADAGRDASGRAYWCLLVSELNGRPQLAWMNAADCAALVRAAPNEHLAAGLAPAFDR